MNEAYPDWDAIRASFADPPLRFRPRPLWFWNNTTITDNGIRKQLRACRDECGYGGVSIVPFGRDLSPRYLSEEYFARYRSVLETARDLGMTVSLYDEYGFPSGSVGSRNSSDTSAFAKAYPERTLHRLDKHELMITGPAKVEMMLPAGQIDAAVAMSVVTRDRIVLHDAIEAHGDGTHSLRWNAPAGMWQVMVFICVHDGETIIDYLDPKATHGFLTLTHEVYYERFAEYFGSTIDSTFYDEPTLYRALGRTWTPRFRDAYRERYDEDPDTLYPALWYDIGAQTAGARHRLFSLRSELFADAFAGVIQKWSAQHGISATGHQDQEEVANPVSVSGDLMKCFRAQAIPGIDKIGGDRPAELFYKVISSAATNWDHSLVMSETYGAMGDIGWNGLVGVAIEQYASGINMLIPHAVWYDPSQVVFKPELSHRNPAYSGVLPAFTTMLARLNLLLQNDGTPICDIALLYPIDGMEAAHRFDGELGPYRGGVAVTEGNYVAVAHALHGHLGLDFMYLHPDVLQDRCVVRDGAIHLANTIHQGRFPLLVMPASRAVRPGVVDGIARLLDTGGALIVVGMLPQVSSDPWQSSTAAGQLRRLVTDHERAIHLPAPGAPATTEAIHAHAAHVAPLLAEAVDTLLPRPHARVIPGPGTRLLHKRYRDHDLLMVANLEPKKRRLMLQFRSHRSGPAEVWDPHRGTIERIGPADLGDGRLETFLTVPPLEARVLVTGAAP